MANLNKVMLIGRLTRDPETRTFSNGGKVAHLGFAVTGRRKKNPQTGQWEDEPCFLDVNAFNSAYENGRKLADICEQYLHKGNQVYIEGHLILDQWTNQEGQKQSKIKVIMDDFQFLEPKPQGGVSGGGGGMSRPAAAPQQPAEAYPSGNGDRYDEAPAPMEPAPAHNEDNIPF